MFTRKTAAVSTISLDAWVALLLVCLGGTTMFGWLLHIPAMVEIKHGLVPMVFNTGLCFFLSGVALLQPPAVDVRTDHIRQCIGAALVILCGITLVEFFLDKSLGVDLASLHTWYDYGNTRPGRMAPNTAIGFALIGLVLFLSSRVSNRLRAFTVVSLTFGIFTIGLTGLVGYLLAPDLLFNWARSARMALHTATGMILCGLGLWLSWSKNDWYIRGTYFTEVGKIRFLSVAIMLIVTTTIGLTGFVVLQGSLETAVANRLEAVVNTRAAWFRTTTHDSTRHAMTALRLSGLSIWGKAWLEGRRNASIEPALDNIGNVLIREGYRGLVLQDASGRPVKTWGVYNANPAIAAPLDPDGSATLVWDQVTVLRVRQPIVEGSQTLGSIEIDIAMPALETPLFNMAALGQKAELAACVKRAGYLICLPNDKNVQPFSVDIRSRRSMPLSMELALKGETGVANAIDYRQHNVIAAYGLVVPGLGLVAKQETTEAYAAIRQSLSIGVPVILVISLLGALILFTQLNPLVTKMRASESAAADAATKVQTIMQAVGDGIVTIDQRGVIHSMNTAGCRLFGYHESELCGNDITMLMPSELREAHQKGITRLASGGAARLLGTPNVQVTGLRKDGSQFPMELTINAAPISGQPYYVGVLRDVTLRKEFEERLTYLAQYDALTGLPNRALFTDRLNTALLRAKRAGRGLAVMFIDLDGFKKINDTYGHQGGDMILIQVATRLQSVVRKSDTVARLSGDEFTIVLEDLTLPGGAAEAVANKIIAIMQSPFTVGGEAARVTASIGLVVHDARIADVQAADLLKQADNEMYLVKHAGKNAFSTH